MRFQTGLWKELLFPNITCLPVPRGEAESWRCLGWWELPKLLIVLINSTDGYYSALPGPVLPRPPCSAVLGPSHSPGILMGFMPQLCLTTPCWMFTAHCFSLLCKSVHHPIGPRCNFFFSLGLVRKTQASHTTPAEYPKTNPSSSG